MSSQFQRAGIASGTASRRHPSGVYDYQTGDKSQWPFQQNGGGEVIVGTALVPQHSARYPNALRVTVNPTTTVTDNPGTMRGEVSQGYTTMDVPDGTVQWYGWSTYFPADFRWDSMPNFFLFEQWRPGQDNGSPLMAMEVIDVGGVAHLRPVARGGTLTGTNTYQYVQTIDCGPIPLGGWVDFTLRVLWSPDPTTGSLSVWMNGNQVLDTWKIANKIPGVTVYFKQGIYCGSGGTKTQVLGYTGTVIGATESDVML